MSKIKSAAKSAVAFFVTHTKIKNNIVFESVPDLGDNTYFVFEELSRRGYGKKYKFVWLVKDKAAAERIAENNPLYENAVFVEAKTKMERYRFRWLCIRSKCLICCNDFLTSFHDKQKSFFLTHGTGIKSLINYTLPLSVDWCITASEDLEEMTARELHYPIEKINTLGFPRNDVLKHGDLDLKEYFGDFKKFVCWYPTFRQQSSKTVQNVGEHAFPIIHSSEAAQKLNDYAKERGVLIVVKPHFAQDISFIKDLGLSNIIFISDNFFKEKGISSYKFLASCDSMITDYSSIFFDYLLCDKPVAAVWEDIEEYRAKRGFSLDIDKYMKCAVKIYNTEDFCSYLDELANNLDTLKAERDEINALVNTYNDDGAAARVTDFIIKTAEL